MYAGEKSSKTRKGRRRRVSLLSGCRIVNVNQPPLSSVGENITFACQLGLELRKLTFQLFRALSLFLRTTFRLLLLPPLLLLLPPLLLLLPPLLLLLPPLLLLLP